MPMRSTRLLEMFYMYMQFVQLGYSIRHGDTTMIVDDVDG